MAKPGTTESYRNMSQDGVDITSPAAMPTGGWGIRGWLSAIYTRLIGDSDALVSISLVHEKVHDGDTYRSGMNFSLANGEVATFSIETPATTEMHVTWDLSASADGTFTLLEDVTSFSGGASVTPLNHDRNSSNVSGATCLRGMTGANLITPTGGTTILNALLSTGKGNTITRESGGEFILKKGSKYLFRYTNGTSANVIQLPIEWYDFDA